MNKDEKKIKREQITVYETKNGAISIVMKYNRLFLRFGYFSSLAFIELDITEVWTDICEFMRSPKADGIENILKGTK